MDKDLNFGEALDALKLGARVKRTSAGLNYVEKVGLIEIAKADLIAIAEGRQ